MFSVYERLVRAIARRPVAFLLLFAVVSVGLFFGASHVRLDGDLARLLPDSSPTVIGLRKLERVYGDEIGRVTVVLSGPDAQRNRDAAAGSDPRHRERSIARSRFADDPETTRRPARIRAEGHARNRLRVGAPAIERFGPSGTGAALDASRNRF